MPQLAIMKRMQRMMTGLAFSLTIVEFAVVLALPNERAVATVRSPKMDTIVMAIASSILMVTESAIHLKSQVVPFQ